MSEHLKLGEIITTPQQRDAVHIAVAPVVAGQSLGVGCGVCLSHTGEAFATAVPSDAIGIVDPFLPRKVSRGERFWLFLNPGSVTSLRHEWRHPAFDALKANESIRWLEAFAEAHEMSYGSLMRDVKLAAQGLRLGHSGWAGVTVPPELWFHYEIAGGCEVAAAHRADRFSCAC